MPAREARGHDGRTSPTRAGCESKRLRVAREEPASRLRREGIADRGVELCERPHAERIGKATQEPHAFEVDQVRLESSRDRTQEDVAGLEVSVVRPRAVKAQHESQQRVERGVARLRGRSLEHVVRTRIGPQVLEQDEGAQGQAEPAPLQIGERRGGADEKHLEAVASRPGPACRRAAQAVGERACEATVSHLFRHDSVSIDHDAAERAAAIVFEDTRIARGEGCRVGGDGIGDGVRRERSQPQAASPRDRDRSAGAPLAQQVPPPARCVDAGTTDGQLADGTNGCTCSQAERPRETERGRTKPNAPRRRDVGRERVVEVGEIDPPRRCRPAGARALEVEQNGNARPHEHVSVVEVAVDEAMCVEAGDRSAERDRDLSPGAGRIERLGEATRLDPLHREQPVASADLSERAWTGHTDPGFEERAQRAPLAVRGRLAEQRATALSPRMPARSDTKLLYEKVAGTGRRDPHDAPVRTVVYHGALAGFEPAKDGSLRGRIARLPANERTQGSTRA